MNDADIRRALERRLGRRRGLLIHELGLANHTSRVDLAHVGRALAGFEIKGDGDTLRRLPAQAAAFSRVFDRMAVVTTERHVPGALEIVSAWWAVHVVHADPEAQRRAHSLTVRTLRPGTANPALDPLGVAELLWRDQALAALKRRGLARGLSAAPRRVLWRELSTRLPLGELRAEALAALTAQRAWIARGARGAL